MITYHNDRQILLLSSIGQFDIYFLLLFHFCFVVCPSWWQMIWTLLKWVTIFWQFSFFLFLSLETFSLSLSHSFQSIQIYIHSFRGNGHLILPYCVCVSFRGLWSVFLLLLLSFFLSFSFFCLLLLIVSWVKDTNLSTGNIR